ncbi:hypothetical protein [Beijerinckia sp. L45]|uniref:hypothetical protein n=1 Tax=Beijerinckia sp. L45 TaxID=1641855 RepID=UPI00131A8501|nr:hypothetical protein [Beijerinckia sp. L45]
MTLPSLQDQIVEAELHALALHNFVDEFAGSRKRPEHEVTRKRERAVVADAVVATLRGLAGTAEPQGRLL